MLPDWFPGCGIERDQPAIQRPNVNLSIPNRDAAIHHVATRVDVPLGRNLWVERPDARASCGIHGKHFAPRGRKVHHAIDNQRRRFLPAVGIEIDIPGQPESIHSLVIDLFERAEALLAVRASIGKPVLWFGVCLHELGIGNISYGWFLRVCPARGEKS